MDELRTGDIFTTKGEGITGWALRHLVTPPTDRFHYGFVWIKAPDGEFLTLESVPPKGEMPGKLSWHGDKEDIQFFRIANCPDNTAYKAPFEALSMARGTYDYLLIIKFILEGIYLFFKILFKEHRTRKLHTTDFHYLQDKLPICTEVVDIGCDSIGYNIIPPGVAPIPNAFKEAELAGKIIRLDIPK